MKVSVQVSRLTWNGWNRLRAKSPKHLIRRLGRLKEVGSRSLDLLKNFKHARNWVCFSLNAGKPMHTAHLMQSIENVIRCVSWFWNVRIKIFFFPWMGYYVFYTGSLKHPSSVILFSFLLSCELSKRNGGFGFNLMIIWIILVWKSTQ